MWFSETKIEDLLDNVKLHFLHIDYIDDEIKNLIQNTIVRICEWHDSIIDINIVKQWLIERLQNKKKWGTLESWLISEFFIHLYLNYIWLKQESLYENLEDPKAIKKWFDWLYSDDNDEIRLLESKSWKITTKNITHKNKIDEAYKDLWKKVSWKSIDSSGTSINSRKNALYHAKVANSNQSLYKQIQEYDSQFRKWMYHIINEFNIIPASTIFFDWKSVKIKNIENFDIVKQEIIKRLNNKHIKKWHILCFSQRTKDLFINYLEEK